MQSVFCIAARRTNLTRKAPMFGAAPVSKKRRLLLGSGVVTCPSRNQAGDERSEQGFAASACVVHELEEAEIKRQLVLRNAPVRAQPGAQQRPKSFHRVGVDFAKAVAVLLAGILASGVADRFVPVLAWCRDPGRGRADPNPV